MAAPSYVFTIARAAEMLGEDEQWLHELADQLEPKDGCFWIYDTDDRATLGFAERGIESLKELSLDQKRRAGPTSQLSPTAALAGWIPGSRPSSRWCGARRSR